MPVNFGSSTGIESLIKVSIISPYFNQFIAFSYSHFHIFIFCVVNEKRKFNTLIACFNFNFFFKLINLDGSSLC